MQWPLPCPSGTLQHMLVRWCFPPLCSWSSSLYGFVGVVRLRCCPASAYGMSILPGFAVSICFNSGEVSQISLMLVYKYFDFMMPVFNSSSYPVRQDYWASWRTCAALSCIFLISRFPAGELVKRGKHASQHRSALTAYDCSWFTRVSFSLTVWEWTRIKTTLWVWHL